MSGGVLQLVEGSFDVSETAAESDCFTAIPSLFVTKLSTVILVVSVAIDEALSEELHEEIFSTPEIRF